MKLTRFGPIITPDMLPGTDGDNINGPSLIRVPDWVPHRLARYYLYFGHHNGSYIRMAHADRIEGPYTLHDGGVLHLAQCAHFAKGHVSSPDVIVDSENRSIRMYFHAPSRRMAGQKSYLALSPDGLAFQPHDEVLGIFYFRVFQHDGFWYALGKSRLHRSSDGLGGFETGPTVYPVSDPIRDPEMNAPGNMRHLAVRVKGDRAQIYFTRQADAPEHIRRGFVDLRRPWNEWIVEDEEFVMSAEEKWEGASLPHRPSISGRARGPVNELRDPYIFEEEGRTFLLYAYAGESGIALAELEE